MTKKHIMGFIFILFSIASFNSFAIFPKTDKDFSLLPPYCKAKLKPSSPNEWDRWSQRIAGIGGIHHYCAALHSYNYSTSHYPKNKEEKAHNLHMLRTVIGEIEYVETHSKNKKHPLFAHIYLQKAKAYGDLGRMAEALTYYNKSISINNKSVRSYLALSKYYQKIGDKKQALDTIKAGLQFKPSSKGLNRRLSELSK